MPRHTGRRSAFGAAVSSDAQAQREVRLARASAGVMATADVPDSAVLPPMAPVRPVSSRSRHPLAAFVVRRIAAGVATLVVASFLIFLATNALPGDAAQAVLGKNSNPQALSTLRRAMHLNRPLLDQYGSWVSGVVRGDFGNSSVALAEGEQTPVAGLIGPALRNSAILAAVTAVLLFPLALLVGTITAIKAGSLTDYTFSYIALVFGALPEFVLGTFLIFIFFIELHWLPGVALVPPGSSPLSHVNDLVLPVLTLLGVALAFIARQLRAGVIKTLKEDYVAAARLAGVPERRVVWRYALRNALAPSVQAFAQTMTYLVGGLIVVETLFAYPGIGSLLVQAVSVRDVAEVEGIALVLAAIYIAFNIMADVIVVLLVPRLRTGLK